MERTNDALATALVAAFPRYLERRLGELAVADTADLEAPLAACVELLGSLVDKHLRIPATRHQESPLELVRIATEPLTGALAVQGVPPARRDERDREIHPDDIYALYPATSRDLGEEVWRLHMRWGFEKARVVAGVAPASAKPDQAPAKSNPAVALFGVPQEQRALLQAAINEQGFETLVWRNPAALAEGRLLQPALVVVDLRHPHAVDGIRDLAGDKITVLAVAEDPDDFTTAGVMALGATEVVPLRGVVDGLRRLLPRIT
jgi:hypothetical protein